MPSRSRLFKVKSIYKVLYAEGVQSFPQKGIWRVKSLFLTWTAALGKILTIDNYQRRNILVVESYCMCKKMENHLNITSKLRYYKRIMVSCAMFIWGAVDQA